MRVQDLLARLGRVRTTTDRSWQATCPTHPDDTPSLTVSLGEDGRILVHCHAGCSTETVVKAVGLTLADLFPSAPSTGGAISATHLPSVADWLRAARKISDAEIARMHARETSRGMAVAFRYQRVDGHPLYEKVRLIGAKKFWRIPARTQSVLYGLPATNAANGRVIITEGELDVHALRSVGIDPVVSVPDGTGSQLTPELLAPLEPFAEILIATDADDPGEKLARRLAEALGPTRCRRLRFSDGGKTFKDAGDALKDGWTRAQFDAAIGGTETFKGTPSNDNAFDDNPYRVVGGRLCNVRTDRHGNETVQPLCNFNATIDEQTTRDDGNEAVTYYLISGHLASGVPLPPIPVNATDFAALNWISKWGHGPTIYAGNGKRDHLRVAIDTRSAPIRRCTYGHTGWRQIDGKWAFLYHGGAVGADNVAVALEPPLDRMAFPEAGGDPVEAMRWSLRLLSCAPMEVVAPLLGAIYAAPLASIMNPDFALWLVGSTGSYKSELATLAQRHYGDFDRTRLPASWCATEASIETSVSVTKDVICVVDDFAPQPDLRSQQDQSRRAEHIIRNVGNRAGRQRMRADLTRRPTRPPRGLVISTGEDVPQNVSIQARLVVVRVDRERVNLDELSALQRSGDQFARAMRAFIAHLQPQVEELHRILPGMIAEARDHFCRVGAHARQPTALAMLYVGLDMALQFALKIGAIDETVRRDLMSAAQQALASIGTEQARELEEGDPIGRYIDVLREEIAQKRAFLWAKDEVEPISQRDSEPIGFRDEQFAYLFPTVARKRVSMCLRAAGEPWNVTAQTLNRGLVKKRIVVPGPENRAETKRRFNGGRFRVLMIPLSVLLDRQPPAPDSAPPGPAVNGPGAAGTGQTTLLNKGFGEPAPMALAAPPPVVRTGPFLSEER